MSPTRHSCNRICVGGYLKTTLIDVAFLQASVINASYIQSLDVNFTQGTIGGFDITNTSIKSDQAAGMLEIGSGATPFIRMKEYYNDPVLGPVSLLGTEILPGILETSRLKVRYSINVDGNEGISGTFLSGDGITTITVKNGIVIGI